MGLTGKITPDQVAKKWDNLKTKFKVSALSFSLSIDTVCAKITMMSAAALVL